MIDAERRLRIEDLCHAALDLPVHERSAFVAAASAGDEALRHDVERLLAYAHTADQFLATPLSAVAAQILSEENSPSLVGRQVGSHQFVSLLGVGGMGQVYRARDTKLGRDVAIKVLPDPFLAIPGRVARFEREARVLATLNHPHIAAIYGFEEADGIRGLVLELVEGATLADRLAGGPLPIHEALAFAQQIADAIESAHEKGIIHRDLKPGNIKITPDGSVKVLDFGLAKVFATEESRDDAQAPTVAVDPSREGVIAGTTAYMSPEQARGKAVDKRTDIWAFGCVLFEMLTGRPAFHGDTSSDTIAAVLQHEPDWNHLPAQTPPGIRRLLRRCLEKEPRRRLRDIGDARLEIEEELNAMGSSGITTSQHATSDRVKAAVRPARLAGWGAVVLGALLLVSSAVTWQRQPSEYVWRDPLAGATATRLTNFEGAEKHAAISRDGKFVAFLWDGDGRWDAWVTQVGTGDFHNRTNGAIAELNNPATRTVAFFPDGLRILLWNRVPDAAGGGLVDTGWAIPTMGGPLQPAFKGRGISELDWSPDSGGTRLVYHPPTDGDPLFVTEPNADTGRQIHVSRAGLHNHFPIWSHDGSFIYFVHGRPLDQNDIWRIRGTGGEPERVTSHNTRVSFPTLLDDRTLLYLATDQDGSGPRIHAIDVDRRVPHRVFAGADVYTSLAASADGRRLVATASRTTARLWTVPLSDRVAADADATALRRPNANGLSPRSGPRYLVYRGAKAGTESHSLWKVPDGGEPIELWSGLDGRVIAGAAIAPDGQRIAFPVQRAGRTHLYVVNADGTAPRRLAEELDIRGAPAWSPDGRWIAVAADRDGDPRVFKIPLDGGAPVLLVKEYSTDPTWSPSGQFLVYTGADVGTTFAVKAVGADGTPRAVPNLVLTRGARRLVFISEETLVVMKGDISHKEFWSVDLRTGRERPLATFRRGLVISDFDVSQDRGTIIFDRTREESDIVLFDLPRR
jgi:Tol biopolymer transport system component